MLGADGQLDLRERANTGQVVSPTLYLAGPSFNGSSVNSPEEAVAKALKQSARLNRLAKAIPADDGKIHSTTELLMNDGRFAPANDEQTGG